MRLLRKTIVLGLAGLGMYKAWELLAPKIDLARHKSSQARDRVEPAVQGARDTIVAARDSARDAASSLVGASKDVIEAATDAVVDAGQEVPAESSSDAGGTYGSGSPLGPQGDPERHVATPSLDG